MRVVSEVYVVGYGGKSGGRDCVLSGSADVLKVGFGGFSTMMVKGRY